MKLKFLPPCAMALLLGALLAAGIPSQRVEAALVAAPISVPTAAPECFPETGQCMDGEIAWYWHANGGLSVFGYPTTDQRPETLADGEVYSVQWFERFRIELHPENNAPYNVLIGRMGVERLGGDARVKQLFPPAAPKQCQYFKETGHNLCSLFSGYWEKNGGLSRFGYPMSEPYDLTLCNGVTYTVQWFERVRMEFHPENPSGSAILLGLLGNEIRANGCG